MKMGEPILEGKWKVIAKVQMNSHFYHIGRREEIVVLILGNTSFTSYRVKKKVPPRVVVVARSASDSDLANDVIDW